MTEHFKLELFNITGAIPPELSVLNSKEAQDVDTFGRYLNALRAAGENTVPRPVTVVWLQESTRIAKAVNSTYRQQKSPEQTMNDLQSALEQIEQQA